MELLQKILETAIDLLLEMAPYLLLGFLFAGILNVLVSASQLSKFVGSKKVVSSIRAALIGIPLPLCSCGVIPTGVSLFRSGASRGATTSFLISTPQTGVDSITLTWFAMGPAWAILRSLVALITGIAGGMTTDILVTDPVPVTIEATSSKKKKYSAFIRVFKYAFVDFLSDISRPLLAGIALAVAITLLLPPSVFTTYLDNPLLNMFIILLASVPLYVCATGSIPVAVALLASGVSPGAILVFLMAGPATNAATITVLWKTIGKKSTIIYVATIVTFAIFFGLLIDYVLPANWFITDAITNHQHAHQHNDINWISAISAILLCLFILFAEIKKIIPSKFFSKSTNMSDQYIVEGMTCNHCKASVEKAVCALEGVSNANAIPAENKLIIEGKIDEKKLKETIEQLGYQFKGKMNS